MNTIIEKVIFLQKVELFSDVPTEQLSHLAAVANRISIEKDKYLFRESDPANNLYLIISGRIHVLRDDALLRQLGPYDEIGLLGFFDNAPRAADALTTENTELLKINKVDFFDLLEDRVHLSHGILQYFVKQIRQLLEAIDTKNLQSYIEEKNNQ